MIEIGAILAGEAARTIAAAALGASVSGAGRLITLLRSRIPGLARDARDRSDDHGGTDGDVDLPALTAEIERAIAHDPALATKIAEALPPAAAPAPTMPATAFYDRSGARARLSVPGTWIVGGPPGAGKTALLWRVAADAAPDPVAYLDLDHDVLRLGDQLDLDAARGEILRQLGLPDAGPARYPFVLARGRYTLLLDNARGEAEIAPLIGVSAAARVLVSTRRLGDDFRRAHPRAIVPLGGLDPDGAWEMLAARVDPALLAAEPDAARRLLEACDRLPYGIQQIAARLSRRSGEPGVLAAELDALHTDDFLDLMVSRALDALSPGARDGLALLTRHPGDGFTRTAATAMLGPATGAILAELDDLALLDRAADGRLRLLSVVRRRPHLLPSPALPDADAALLRLLGHHVRLGVAADVALTRPDRLRPYPLPSGLAWPLATAPLDWLTASAGALFALTAQALHRARHGDVLRLCGTLEVLLLYRGYHERCDEAFTHGITAAAALGDLCAQARFTALRGRVALLRGRLPDAADLFDSARNLLSAARAGGLDTARFDSSLAEFRARLAEDRGDLAAAAGLLRAALAADRAADWSYSRGIHARMLANVLVKAGLPAEALDASDEAAAHTTDRRNAGRVHTVRAKALLALHRLDEAVVSLAAAREAAADTTQYRPELDELDGDLAFAAGHPTTARLCWSRVVDHALKTGDDRRYTDAMRRLARLPR